MKRHEETFLFAKKLTVDAQEIRSDTFLCDGYSDFLLMYDITKKGTPPNLSTVQIYVLFHDEDGNAYPYEDGVFGLLLEEESSMDCKRAFAGKCIGREMSIKAVAAGTLSGTNYFTVNARAQFFSRENK